ncbi:carnitine dehydratase [Novosphingobium sp. AAP83]|uniref:CaiB/BaiF CoA transferase family protein n=1 Tax=Novosphingobium sp. AAP83 TaxID=1523425 RepID=UPI0006B90ED4|nr:CoA transferase [Novosphingobium sp. AAP83]KPF89815.1 carnitine dehydratase [Novosphingobium sp. AAP83]
MRSPPLSGVRIVDFTTFLSGPFCTQLFGDLGADVIKIESFEGDSSRSIPPHFVDDDSAYYLSTNRNKRSIALNLKTPEGLATARKLIAKADIVVENFRPGICARLGLDPAVIRKDQPELIWVSISGFGQVSPWRDRPAYDMIVQALSGVMSLTGEEGRSAMRLGIPAGDIIAGMYATIAALAALARRGRDGEGQTIDISMLDGQLSMLSYQAQYHLISGTMPGPQGAGHDSIPTYRSFRAGDGREFVVTANTDGMWRSMCNVLGLPELPELPEFATQGLRLANRELLWSKLEQAFLARSAVEWVEALTKEGVPVALIKNVGEAIADAREHGRDMIVPVEGYGRNFEMIGSPMKLEGVDMPLDAPPPLSCNAMEILSGLLGLDSAEIGALQEAGALLLPHAVKEK